MQQIRFPLGLHPKPHWGSLQHSPDRLAVFKGPTSKEREGKGNERKGRRREGKRKGRGGKGREGRGNVKPRALKVACPAL